MSDTDEFFDEKRPWSRIKDEVIANYMPPFVAKVAKRGSTILLVDAFAGPGVFADGSPGSPMLMCKAAAKYTTNWQAVFINDDRHHHEKLNSVVEKAGWGQRALTFLGDSRELLSQLENLITDHSVFLYLDPFGLTGIDFSLLELFLKREKQYITEVMINLQMPAMHRHAAWHLYSKGETDDPNLVRSHRILNLALGGSWWKEILLNDEAPALKEQAIIKGYAERLARYLPITGYCPVQETSDTRVKYYITFASHHEHARLKLNDIMYNAYQKHIVYADIGASELQPSLFSLDALRDRKERELDQVILTLVRERPGIQRQDAWKIIVANHFMRFLEKDFNARLIHLADKQQIIDYKKDPGTKRRNKTSKLWFLGN